MEILKKCRNHLKFLGTLRGRKLSRYIDKKASSQIIKCLYELALNFVYSPYNIFHQHQHTIKKRIKKHKKNIIKLINTKKRKDQRKILKVGGLSLTLLDLLSTVFASIVSLL